MIVIRGRFAKTGLKTEALDNIPGEVFLNPSKGRAARIPFGRARSERTLVFRILFLTEAEDEAEAVPFVTTLASALLPLKAFPTTELEETGIGRWILGLEARDTMEATGLEAAVKAESLKKMLPKVLRCWLSLSD